MGREGWDIGAHTVDHPVLTSVAPTEAEEQIAASAARIAREVGRPVRAAAYPNGLEGDFEEEVARRAGMDLAFTLLPGPARAQEVRAQPLAVRRTYVPSSATLGVVSAKVMGLGRILGAGG